MSISEVYNGDCMEYMAKFPDKFFELAIVDPPYGIDINRSGRLVKEKGWLYKDWDNNIPSVDYFKELKRVSINQIIWGGNYFNLGATKCFIIWDKKQPPNVSFASCELAWTSFTSVAKTFYLRPQGQDRIHPTQKPVALYKWLLQNYAKEGDKILDTHMGSQSSRIAAYDMGFDYYGSELDKDYFDAWNKRFESFKQQLTLFR